MTDTIQRKIRSFVMRTSKMTNGQKRALEELLPQFKLDENTIFDNQKIFGNDNPVCIDMGFGNGESLIHSASMLPETNFIGIEVHSPGVGHLLLAMQQKKLENIRLYQQDGTEILKDCFQNNSIDALHIYFPDPWHKKRHHKRRLIQKNFIELILPKLKPQARVHLATDWQPYAEHMQDVLSEFPQFINQIADNGFSQRPDYRPITKFERRGIKLGHKSYDLIYHLDKE